MSQKPSVIHVTVSGPVGSGKALVLALIESLLRREGVSVASPDLDAECRLVPESEIQRLMPTRTVLVLSEEVESC